MARHLKYTLFALDITKGRTGIVMKRLSKNVFVLNNELVKRRVLYVTSYFPRGRLLDPGASHELRTRELWAEPEGRSGDPTTGGSAVRQGPRPRPISTGQRTSAYRSHLPSILLAVDTLPWPQPHLQTSPRSTMCGVPWSVRSGPLPLPTNPQALCAQVQVAWHGLAQDSIRDLYNSMPQRLDAWRSTTWRSDAFDNMAAPRNTKRTNHFGLHGPQWQTSRSTQL
ncbi:Protein of unknown function [Gryllus bimaculatus]|nr:Protein of unknown function [Gryllus bimaculatus]